MEKALPNLLNNEAVFQLLFFYILLMLKARNSYLGFIRNQV